MSERFERELKEAFQRRADGVPEDAFQRLRGTDFRPRPPARRAAFALTGLATAGATAAISLSLAGVGGGPQRAFAGWTPVPTPAVSGRRAAAEAACLKETTRSAAQYLTWVREMRQHELRQSAREHRAPRRNRHLLLSSLEAGGWRTAIADTRGPYTFVVLAGADGTATCLTGPDPARIVGLGAVFEPPGAGLRAAPADGIVELGIGYTSVDGGGRGFSHAEGKAGAGVKAVRFVLADRTRVTASVANGWYLAWWPGNRPVAAVETVAAGRTTVRSVPKERWRPRN
jgi:hypothetical protein